MVEVPAGAFGTAGEVAEIGAVLEVDGGVVEVVVKVVETGEFAAAAAETASVVLKAAGAAHAAEVVAVVCGAAGALK